MSEHEPDPAEQNPAEQPQQPEVPQQPAVPQQPEAPPQYPQAPPQQPVPPEPPFHAPQQSPAQPFPHVARPEHTPQQYALPLGAPPSPPPGGWIWLGIVLGVAVPIVGISLLGWISSQSGYFNFALSSFPLWGTVIAAIVLTCIRATRRTGIGMWIGIAALPIIGFGVCTAMLFSL